jgi:hypothetical protein
MQNYFKKLTGVMTAMLMGMTLAAPVTPIAAAGTTYTAIHGGPVKVEKYLVMDKNANVPNVTFNYTIAPGAAQNASGTNAKVFAGNDANAVAGTPTIGTATFAQGQQTWAEAQAISSTGTQAVSGKKDPVTLDANQKYARSDIAVDFSGVTFKEPGIYRWLITETASDATKGITDDSDNSRVLDVYVEDDNGSLIVRGYVLHNNANDAAVPMEYAAGDPTTKTNGFVNTYTSHDLTLSKTVAGNQASHDEYFKFTLSISNAIAGTVYDVDLQNADATTKTNAINTTAHTNPASLTVGQDGTITQEYWLQNGQSIVVKGLANNTSYSIAEDKTAMDNEGYTPSVVVTGDNKTTGNADIAFASDTYQISDNAITADTTAAFTNTKTGTIPTGIIMKVLPYGALIGVAVVAIILNRRKGQAL